MEDYEEGRVIYKGGCGELQGRAWGTTRDWARLFDRRVQRPVCLRSLAQIFRPPVDLLCELVRHGTCANKTCGNPGTHSGPSALIGSQACGNTGTKSTAINVPDCVAAWCNIPAEAVNMTVNGSLPPHASAYVLTIELKSVDMRQLSAHTITMPRCCLHVIPPARQGQGSVRPEWWGSSHGRAI